MANANPNPKPENLTAPTFQPGQSGNPGGKTSQQRKAEVAAAEQAALIQKAMLDALALHVASDPSAALDAIKADPLKLIKDAMDRGYGTAVQKIDSTSSDGTMTPSRGPDLSGLSAKELAAYERLTDKAGLSKGVGAPD